MWLSWKDFYVIILPATEWEVVHVCQATRLEALEAADIHIQ